MISLSLYIYIYIYIYIEREREGERGRPMLCCCLPPLYEVPSLMGSKRQSLEMTFQLGGSQWDEAGSLLAAPTPTVDCRQLAFWGVGIRHCREGPNQSRETKRNAAGTACSWYELRDICSTDVATLEPWSVKYPCAGCSRGRAARYI